MERPQTQHARIRATVKRIGVLAGFLEGEGSFDRSGGSSRISAHQVNREPMIGCLTYLVVLPNAIIRNSLQHTRANQVQCGTGM